MRDFRQFPLVQQAARREVGETAAQLASVSKCRCFSARDAQARLTLLAGMITLLTLFAGCQKDGPTDVATGRDLAQDLSEGPIKDLTSTVDAADMPAITMTGGLASPASPKHPGNEVAYYISLTNQARPDLYGLTVFISLNKNLEPVRNFLININENPNMIKRYNLAWVETMETYGYGFSIPIDKFRNQEVEINFSVKIAENSAYNGNIKNIDLGIYVCAAIGPQWGCSKPATAAVFATKEQHFTFDLDQCVMDQVCLKGSICKDLPLSDMGPVSKYCQPGCRDNSNCTQPPYTICDTSSGANHCIECMRSQDCIDKSGSVCIGKRCGCNNFVDCCPSVASCTMTCSTNYDCVNAEIDTNSNLKLAKNEDDDSLQFIIENNALDIKRVLLGLSSTPNIIPKYGGGQTTDWHCYEPDNVLELPVNYNFGLPGPPHMRKVCEFKVQSSSPTQPISVPPFTMGLIKSFLPVYWRVDARVGLQRADNTILLLPPDFYEDKPPRFIAGETYGLVGCSLGRFGQAASGSFFATAMLFCIMAHLASKRGSRVVVTTMLAVLLAMDSGCGPSIHLQFVVADEANQPPGHTVTIDNLYVKTSLTGYRTRCESRVDETCFWHLDQFQGSTPLEIDLKDPPGPEATFKVSAFGLSERRVYQGEEVKGYGQSENLQVSLWSVTGDPCNDMASDFCIVGSGAK